MNLTAILFVALAITGLLGASGTLWYRSEYKDCQASVAIEAAKAEEKLNAQKEADAKFTRGLEEATKTIKDEIREKANATQAELAKVKSDPNCLRTPAASAFDQRLQPNPQPPASGPPRPAKP